MVRGELEASEVKTDYEGVAKSWRRGPLIETWGGEHVQSGVASAGLNVSWSQRSVPTNPVLLLGLIRHAKRTDCRAPPSTKQPFEFKHGPMIPSSRGRMFPASCCPALAGDNEA